MARIPLTHGWAKRTLTVLLSLSLVWSSAPLAEAAVHISKGEPARPPAFYRELAPPPSLGRVTDYYAARPESCVLSRESNTATLARDAGPKTQDSRLVVLIQDLHAHYGVQKNIAGILEFLAKRLSPSPSSSPTIPPVLSRRMASLPRKQGREVKGEEIHKFLSPGGRGQGEGASQVPFQIAVEGAEGPIDSSLMALFPDQKIKRDALDYLMREGELTGMEHFAAMRGILNLLVGVEDGRYYNIHRELFRKTLQDREKLVGSLKGMQAEIVALRPTVYSRPLKVLQRKIDAFGKGTLPFADYAAFLLKQARQRGVPLSPALAGYLAKGSGAPVNLEWVFYEIQELAWRVKLAMGHEQRARRSKMSLRGSGPEGAPVATSDVPAATEIATRSPEVLATARNDNRDRSPLAGFLQVEHDLDLLLRVADLRATEPEVRAFGPRLNQFVALASALLRNAGPESQVSSPESTASDPGRGTRDSGHETGPELRRLLSAAVDYYALALMRNKPMVERTLALLSKTEGLGLRTELKGKGSVIATRASSALHREARGGNLVVGNTEIAASAFPVKENGRPPRNDRRELLLRTQHSGLSTAVLVAGGFHTAQITQLLREKNVSYVVLTPTIDKYTEADHALYVKRLSGNHLTVEGVLAAATGPMAPGSRQSAEIFTSPSAPQGLAVGFSASVGLLFLARAFPQYPGDSAALLRQTDAAYLVGMVVLPEPARRLWNWFKVKILPRLWKKAPDPTGKNEAVSEPEQPGSRPWGGQAVRELTVEQLGPPVAEQKYGWVRVASKDKDEQALWNDVERLRGFWDRVWDFLKGAFSFRGPGMRIHVADLAGSGGSSYALAFKHVGYGHIRMVIHEALYRDILARYTQTRAAYRLAEEALSRAVADQEKAVARRERNQAYWTMRAIARELAILAHHEWDHRNVTADTLKLEKYPLEERRELALREVELDEEARVARRDLRRLRRWQAKGWGLPAWLRQDPYFRGLQEIEQDLRSAEGTLGYELNLKIRLRNHVDRLALLSGQDWLHRARSRTRTMPTTPEDHPAEITPLTADKKQTPPQTEKNDEFKGPTHVPLFFQNTFVISPKAWVLNETKALTAMPVKLTPLDPDIPPIPSLERYLPARLQWIGRLLQPIWDNLFRFLLTSRTIAFGLVRDLVKQQPERKRTSQTLELAHQVTDKPYRATVNTINYFRDALVDDYAIGECHKLSALALAEIALHSPDESLARSALETLFQVLPKMPDTYRAGVVSDAIAYVAMQEGNERALNFLKSYILQNSQAVISNKASAARALVNAAIFWTQDKARKRDLLGFLLNCIMSRDIRVRSPAWVAIKQFATADPSLFTQRETETLLSWSWVDQGFFTGEHDRLEPLHVFEILALTAPQEFFTAHVVARLNRVFGQEESYKYLLFYLTARHHTGPLLYPQEAFSAHQAVHKILLEGPAKVLIIQNIADGQGDELIRLNTLIQAFLDNNPELEVTLLTNRPYLYDHPRVKIFSVKSTQDITRPGRQRSSRLLKVIKKIRDSSIWSLCGWLIPIGPIVAASLHMLLSIPCDRLGVMREAIDLHEYGMVIDHYDPSQVHNKELEGSVRGPSLIPSIYLRTNKANDTFIYESISINVPHPRGTLVSKLHIPTGMDNVYDPIYRMLAELGLRFSPYDEAQHGNSSLLVGKPYPNADRWWDENIEWNRPIQGRPVAIYNPFGGESEDKGTPRHAAAEAARELAQIINQGYSVILLPNHQPWGNTRAAGRILHFLDPSLRKYIVIAPSPSTDSRLHKYLVAKADCIFTVEGGLMHLALNLNKDFVALPRAHSGNFDKWLSYNRRSGQQISPFIGLVGVQTLPGGRYSEPKANGNGHAARSTLTHPSTYAAGVMELERLYAQGKLQRLEGPKIMVHGHEMTQAEKAWIESEFAPGHEEAEWRNPLRLFLFVLGHDHRSPWQFVRRLAGAYGIMAVAGLFAAGQAGATLLSASVLGFNAQPLISRAGTIASAWKETYKEANIDRHRAYNLRQLERRRAGKTSAALADVGKGANQKEIGDFLERYPGMAAFGPEWIAQHWQDLVALGQAAGVNAGYLFSDGLPALKDAFGPEWIAQHWQDLKNSLLTLLNNTTDYNRERTLKLILSVDHLKFLYGSKADPLAHLNFYAQIFAGEKRLGFQILEGLVEGFSKGQVDAALPEDEKKLILDFTDKLHSFSPALFVLYKKDPEDALKSLFAFAEKILKDEVSQQDVRRLSDSYQKQGVDSLEALAAAIQIAIPASGASFVKREEIRGLLEKYIEAGDLRRHVPEALRRKDFGDGEKDAIPLLAWTLKRGKRFDPDSKIAQALSALRDPEPDLAPDQKEQRKEQDRQALKNALRQYLRDKVRSPDGKAHALEAFYAYARYSDQLGEKIDRIQPEDYTSLLLLEQLFLDKDNLFVLMKEVLEELFTEDTSLQPREAVQASALKKPGKLAKTLSGIWEGRMSEAQKKTALAGALRGVSAEDIREKLLPLLQEESLKEAVEDAARQVQAARAVPLEELVEELFQEPLETLGVEKGKFERKEQDRKVILEFRVVKGIPYGLWGLNAGVCIATDLELWKDSRFFLLAIIDKSQNKAVGFVHLYEAQINGRRVLTVPGIEPSVEFLSEVRAEQVYPLIEKALKRLAQVEENGVPRYAALDIPAEANILSNRPDIAREVQKRLRKHSYQEVTYDSPVSWNRLPGPYPFDKAYRVWSVPPGPEQTSLPLTHASTYAAGMRYLEELRADPEAWQKFNEQYDLGGPLVEVNGMMMTQGVKAYIEQDFAPWFEAHHFQTEGEAVRFALEHGGTREQQRRRVEGARQIARVYQATFRLAFLAALATLSPMKAHAAASYWASLPAVIPAQAGIQGIWARDRIVRGRRGAAFWALGDGDLAVDVARRIAHWDATRESAAAHREYNLGHPEAPLTSKVPIPDWLVSSVALMNRILTDPRGQGVLIRRLKDGHIPSWELVFNLLEKLSLVENDETAVNPALAILQEVAADSSNENVGRDAALFILYGMPASGRTSHVSRFLIQQIPEAMKELLESKVLQFSLVPLIYTLRRGTAAEISESIPSIIRLARLEQHPKVSEKALGLLKDIVDGQHKNAGKEDRLKALNAIVEITRSTRNVTHLRWLMGKMATHFEQKGQPLSKSSRFISLMDTSSYEGLLIVILGDPAVPTALRMYALGFMSLKDIGVEEIKLARSLLSKKRDAPSSILFPDDSIWFNEELKAYYLSIWLILSKGLATHPGSAFPEERIPEMINAIMNSALLTENYPHVANHEFTVSRPNLIAYAPTGGSVFATFAHEMGHHIAAFYAADVLRGKALELDEMLADFAAYALLEIMGWEPEKERFRKMFAHHHGQVFGPGHSDQGIAKTNYQAARAAIEEIHQYVDSLRTSRPLKRLPTFLELLGYSLLYLKEHGNELVPGYEFETTVRALRSHAFGVPHLQTVSASPPRVEVGAGRETVRVPRWTGLYGAAMHWGSEALCHLLSGDWRGLWRTIRAMFDRRADPEVFSRVRDALTAIFNLAPELSGLREGYTLRVVQGWAPGQEDARSQEDRDHRLSALPRGYRGYWEKDDGKRIVTLVVRGSSSFDRMRERGIHELVHALRSGSNKATVETAAAPKLGWPGLRWVIAHWREIWAHFWGEEWAVVRDTRALMRTLAQVELATTEEAARAVREAAKDRFPYFDGATLNALLTHFASPKDRRQAYTLRAEFLAGLLAAA